LRHQVAQLLEAVIDEQLSAQVAINRWPVPQTVVDASLECAFWALWHFEADEIQQQTEVYYLDAQLELLRQMAKFLEQGQDLPNYMLASYAGQEPVRFYYKQSPWDDYLKRIQMRWAHIRLFYQNAFALISKK
jgi:hypothetical protein